MVKVLYNSYKGFGCSVMCEEGNPMMPEAVEQKKKKSPTIVIVAGIAVLLICCLPSIFQEFMSPGKATETPNPTNTPEPTNTPLVPINTPSPVPPTNTPVPTFTATPEPALESLSVSSEDCTWVAAYVSDVTIPDGTRLDPGTAFEKTWRLRNTGSCGWDGVKLRFSAGEQMSGQGVVTVPVTDPGAEVDVTVPMVAPEVAGSYRGVWSVCQGDVCFYDVTVNIISGAEPTAAPTLAPTVDVPPTQAPAPTSPPSSPGYPAGVWLCPENTEGAAYVGSITSDKFHYPNCRWAKKIQPGNRLCFTSREVAIGYGYVPCGACKP